MIPPEKLLYEIIRHTGKIDDDIVVDSDFRFRGIDTISGGRPQLARWVEITRAMMNG